MDKYKLLKPITFEGTEITEIEYDLDSITGDAIIKAERELGVTGDVKVLPYNSPEMQAHLFAGAAKKPVELIRALKAPDFAEVTSKVALFLMGQD